MGDSVVEEKNNCPWIDRPCLGDRCNWWCEDDIIVHMTDKSITVTNCLYIGGVAGRTVRSDYELWKEWKESLRSAGHSQSEGKIGPNQ